MSFRKSATVRRTKAGRSSWWFRLVRLIQPVRLAFGEFRQGDRADFFERNLKEALGTLHQADIVRANRYPETVEIVNPGEALHTLCYIHPLILIIRPLTPPLIRN